LRKTPKIKILNSTDIPLTNSFSDEGGTLYKVNDILKLLKKDKFDIVIFDFKMKIKDNKFLLEKLKFAEVKTKIIIFTKYSKGNKSLMIIKKENPLALIIEQIPNSVVGKIKSSIKCNLPAISKHKELIT